MAKYRVPNFRPKSLDLNPARFLPVLKFCDSKLMCLIGLNDLRGEI